MDPDPMNPNPANPSPTSLHAAQTSARRNEPSFDLAAYQALPAAELLRRARDGGMEDPQPTRAELVFAVVALDVDADTTGTASGILDIRPEGFGFLRNRTHGCRAGADDVYLSPNQVQRLRLENGHEVKGVIRQPRPGERYFAMVRVDQVDGVDIDARGPSLPFQHTTPVLPGSRLTLAYPGCPPSLSVLDQLVPLGFGQRVLITAPRDAQRTALLGDIATGAIHNHPGSRFLLLLIDQAPEDAEAISRRFARSHGPVEVFASTFEEPPERHAELMRLVEARALRLVEAGNDVVLLVDSLTHLVRAHNASVPHSGKIISPGLDAHALLRPKALFCRARQAEEGPSLTIFATLLDDGGMNAAIATEFEGRANADIVLAEELIRNHVDPPIDVHRTRTRNEDNVLSQDDLAAARQLRSSLEAMTNAEAVQHLASRTPTR